MKKIILLTCFVGTAYFGFSQTISHAVLGATGTTMSNSSGQLTVSLGETSIKLYQSTNQMLSEGFIQPKMSEKDLTEISFSEMEGNKLSIYPSPFTSQLTILFDGEISLAQVYGLDGQLIASTKEAKSSIDFTNFAAGIYFVKAFDEKSQLIETKKAIKL